MTILAILADVHGNLPALQAVAEDFKAFQPESILVAGDLTGGPQANECIRLLQGLGGEMILGNSDLNLLRLADGCAPGSWSTSRQFGLLRWALRNIDQHCLKLLRGLPEQRVFRKPGVHPIRVVHGSIRDPYESLYPERETERLDLALAQTSEAVLVCGHTHEPWILRRNGKLALNPGAVAAPLNAEIGAQYALLRWEHGGWQAELRRVDYDLSAIRRAYETSGLLVEGRPLAGCHLLGIESGRDIALQFLTYAHRLAETAGFGRCTVLPDEIWEQAEASFDWENAGTEAMAMDETVLMHNPGRKAR